MFNKTTVVSISKAVKLIFTLITANMGVVIQLAVTEVIMGINVVVIWGF